MNFYFRDKDRDSETHNDRVFVYIFFFLKPNLHLDKICMWGK